MADRENEIVNALRRFKRLRDDALHSDVADFEHHLAQLLEGFKNIPVVDQVIRSLPEVNVESWWEDVVGKTPGRPPIKHLRFPPNDDETVALQVGLLREIGPEFTVRSFSSVFGSYKSSDAVDRLKSMVLQPACKDLTDRLREVANLASPERREQLGVPPERIPGDKELRIFLSHKSADKGLVRRYYETLQILGFSPWLDEKDLPAGTVLERGLQQGFEESCAVIFFITPSFEDEKYLATEIDYALEERRERAERFQIITLCFGEGVAVPKPLRRFVYKQVTNDLVGFREILAALPIEVGPILWKKGVVD